MAAVIVSGIPGTICDKTDLYSHFSQHSSGGGYIQYLLYPFQSDRNKALVSFKDATAAENVVRKKQRLFGSNLVMSQPATQVFSNLSAELDPLTVACIPDVPAYMRKLRRDVGVEVKQSTDNDAIILYGSMWQIKEVQDKLEAVRIEQENQMKKSYNRDFVLHDYRHGSSRYDPDDRLSESLPGHYCATDHDKTIEQVSQRDIATQSSFLSDKSTKEVSPYLAAEKQVDDIFNSASKSYRSSAPIKSSSHSGVYDNTHSERDSVIHSEPCNAREQDADHGDTRSQRTIDISPIDQRNRSPEKNDLFKSNGYDSPSHASREEKDIEKNTTPDTNTVPVCRTGDITKEEIQIETEVARYVHRIHKKKVEEIALRCGVSLVWKKMHEGSITAIRLSRNPDAELSRVDVTKAKEYLEKFIAKIQNSIMVDRLTYDTNVLSDEEIRKILNPVSKAWATALYIGSSSSGEITIIGVYSIVRSASEYLKKKLASKITSNDDSPGAANVDEARGLTSEYVLNENGDQKLALIMRPSKQNDGVSDDMLKTYPPASEKYSSLTTKAERDVGNIYGSGDKGAMASTWTTNYGMDLNDGYTSVLKPPSDAYSFYTPEKIKVLVYTSDITRLQVGAIVNPANSNLKHLAGLAGVISRKAGHIVQDECTRFVLREKPLQVSENFATGAGHLPCDYIIHAVGPMMSMYTDEEPCAYDLKQTVVGALHRANQELQVQKFAMPAISTGIFKVPEDVCGRSMFEGIMQFSQEAKKRKNQKCHIKEIHQVNLVQDVTDLFVAMFQQLKERFDDSTPPEAEEIPGEIVSEDMAAMATAELPQLDEEITVKKTDVTSSQTNSSSKYVSEERRYAPGSDLVSPASKHDEVIQSNAFEDDLIQGIKAIQVIPQEKSPGENKTSDGSKVFATIEQQTSAALRNDKSYRDASASITSPKKLALVDDYGEELAGFLEKDFDTLHISGHSSHRSEYGSHEGTPRSRSYDDNDDIIQRTSHGETYSSNPNTSSKDTYDKTPLNSKHSTPQATARSSTSPHGSLHNTPHGSLHGSILGSLHNTPLNTPKTTPAGSLHATPAGSFHATPAGSLHATPAGSLHATPAGSRHTTPLNTPREIYEENIADRSSHSIHSTPRGSVHNSLYNSAHNTPRNTSQDSVHTTPAGSSHGTPRGNTLTSTTGTSYSAFHTPSHEPLHVSGHNTPYNSLRSSPLGTPRGLTHISAPHSSHQATPPAGSLHVTPAGSLHATPAGSLHATPAGSSHSTPHGSMRGSPIGSLHSTPRASLHGSIHSTSADIDGYDFDDMETCEFCANIIVNLKHQQECGHKLCNDCMTFNEYPNQKCPLCDTSSKSEALVGSQPANGKMTEQIDRSIQLPGFSDIATIVINYRFPSGVQQACHPEPGKHYDGITRTAYLPANAEGREVLLLLKRAFDEGLTFTIGNSTSGRSGVITWNDIRHKTRIDGGRRQMGYPDPEYLQNVKDDLAEKGIN